MADETEAQTATAGGHTPDVRRVGCVMCEEPYECDVAAPDASVCCPECSEEYAFAEAESDPDPDPAEAVK